MAHGDWEYQGGECMTRIKVCSMIYLSYLQSIISGTWDFMRPSSLTQTVEFETNSLQLFFPQRSCGVLECVAFWNMCPRLSYRSRYLCGGCDLESVSSSALINRGEYPHQCIDLFSRCHRLSVVSALGGG